MKKLYRTALSLTLLLAGSLGVHQASAQAPSDAYRNNLQELSGTARAQGLGGAVGAMGADPTAVHVNPAGIGLYTRRSLSATLEVAPSNTSTNWVGAGGDSFGTSHKWTNTTGNFSLAAPLVRRNVARDWHLNWGFSFNRDYTFKRDYELVSSAPEFGITDYFAFQGNLLGLPNRTERISPLVDIARDAAFIEAYTDAASVVPEGAEDRYRSMFGAVMAGTSPDDGKVHLFLPLGSDLRVTEKGGKDSYDFTLGMGLRDRFYLGATFRLGAMNYSRGATYKENFSDFYNGGDYNSDLRYDTYLNVSGASFGLNLGALVALGDYGRIGISYLLPQVGTYNEIYSASAYSNNDSFGEGDKITTVSTGEYESSYNMRMPGQLTVSAMGFLGGYGFASYDFQYRDLGGSKLYARGSLETLSESDFIKEDYGAEITHRVGVEVRPISALAIRAGYSYTGNPMKSEQLKNEPAGGLTYNAVPSGYITDFVIPRSYQTVSAGAGFNITNNLSLDLAYVYGLRTERAYPFSGDSGEVIVDEYVQNGTRNTEYGIRELASVGGDLKTTNHKILATLTLSF